MAENLDLGRIVMTPGVCGGRPRIRGTRMTVVDLLAGLTAGDTADDIVADFPEISHEDIAAGQCYIRGSLCDIRTANP